MSMVDGFPYKEEVGGSSPSVPTIVSVRQVLGLAATVTRTVAATET